MLSLLRRLGSLFVATRFFVQSLNVEIMNAKTPVVRTDAKINTEQQSAISAHGERDYPYECCGLLLGHFAKDAPKFALIFFPFLTLGRRAKRNRF